MVKEDPAYFLEDRVTNQKSGSSHSRESWKMLSGSAAEMDGARDEDDSRRIARQAVDWKPADSRRRPGRPRTDLQQTVKQDLTEEASAGMKYRSGCRQGT